jgi:hypothetical protein
MYENICKYCKEKILVENGRTFANHVRHCKQRPIEDKQKGFANISKSVNNRYDNLLGKLKEFDLVCCKCGKTNKKKIRESEYLKYQSGELKNYCIRSCSNSRIHTKESKDKVSKTISKIWKETPEVYKNSSKFTIENGHYLTKLSKNENLKVKWYDYKNLRLRGTFELRIAIILDKMIELEEILKWEYEVDFFYYIDSKGKNRKYSVDFKVWENNNKFYYIEAKGRDKELDSLKYKAITDLGNELNIWHIKDIIKKEKEYNIYKCFYWNKKNELKWRI